MVKKDMENRLLRVAIIGAGPSGFYAADALLKGLENVTVDLFDRLPTPFGLVRYGVAPDHQKIKSVTRLYERTAKDERFRFLGNVEFGKDLSHEDAKRFYDAIIYTVGASSDRSLGIPGEDLTGSTSATEFVAWYNGHPDYTNAFDEVSAKQVAVIGVGNVAVDVTRILAKSVDELGETDIADHALEVLNDSRVKDIYMLGRRGPAQGKFTTKELRELGELLNADIVVDKADMNVDKASMEAIEGDIIATKNVEVLQAFAEQKSSGKPRRVHIKFLVSPVEIIGDSKVEAIKLEKNRLEPTESGYINAVGTGEYETLPVQMVLRSVGYRGVALPGVPFDERRGIIPNKEGAVLSEPGGEPIPGEYVAGWIKRGPSGVIGTNKADAMATVKKLVSDFEGADFTAEDAKTPEAVTSLLKERGVEFVTFEDWLTLDKHELSQGESQGRPRVKLTTVSEMLEQLRR